MTIDPILVTAGFGAAEMIVKKGADLAAGHWGYQVLDNVINESKGQFGNLIGGKLIGPLIAGGAVNDIASSVSGVASALDTIGQAALLGAQHYFMSAEKFEKIINADGSEVEAAILGYNAEENMNQVNWTDTATTASKLLSAGAILVSAAGVAGAGITVPLGIAVLRAAPGLIDVFSNPSSQKEVDFVDDIIKKITIDLFANLSGTIASNITRYNVVKNAYDNSIKNGESIAIGANYVLPEALHETTKKIGAAIGWLLAGEKAMSNETIDEANRAGELVGNMVGNGIKCITSAVTQTTASDNNSMWEMARKAAWVAGGVLAGGALTFVAPEIAFVAGATAALGVTNKIAAYALQKLTTKQPDEAQALATSQPEVKPEEVQALATNQPEALRQESAAAA